jgi:hypothetical protein
MSASMTEQGIGSKTALTRLLDLLAGWSAYVSADEENQVHDPDLAADEIGALYQLAGELSEEWEKLSIEGRDEAVSAFVEERIVPLLLRGSSAA